MSQLLLTASDVEIGLAPARPREGLRTVRPQEPRSIDAVKHGHELQALTTAARATQDRRRTSRSSARSTMTRSSVVVTG
jgi:hypothetical protein